MPHFPQKCVDTLRKLRRKVTIQKHKPIFQRNRYCYSGNVTQLHVTRTLFIRTNLTKYLTKSWHTRDMTLHFRSYFPLAHACECASSTEWQTSLFKKDTNIFHEFYINKSHAQLLYRCKTKNARFSSTGLSLLFYVVVCSCISDRTD
jgi:hypothetical protein